MSVGKCLLRGTGGLDTAPHHADGEEEVPEVGEGGAPGVVADGEEAAVEVFVVGCLVDAVAVGAGYVVHADGGLEDAVVVRQLDIAEIVFGRLSVGIVQDAEGVEGEVEGHGLHVEDAFLLSLLQIETCGFAFAQRYEAAMAGEVGGEGSGEDDEETDMQTEHSGPTPHAMLVHRPASTKGQDAPKGCEPPRSVAVLQYEWGAHKVLDNGDDGDDEGEEKANIIHNA